MADAELVEASSEAIPMLTQGLEMRPVVPKVPWMTRIEEHSAWPVLSHLSMQVAAEIPLNRIKVRDLLRLEVGQVLESAWPDSEDVPVKAAEVQLGWSEFEVVEQQLAVRLTRLA